MLSHVMKQTISVTGHILIDVLELYSFIEFNL